MKSSHKTVLGLLLALTISFTVGAIVSKINDSKKDDSEKDDSEKDDTSMSSWLMLTYFAVVFLFLSGFFYAYVMINNHNKRLKLEDVLWSPKYLNEEYPVYSRY
jgi:hypothetical protein